MPQEDLWEPSPNKEVGSFKEVKWHYLLAGVEKANSAASKQRAAQLELLVYHDLSDLCTDIAWPIGKDKMFSSC